VLATGLLVVHDTSRGGEDDVTEGTGGEKGRDPLLDLGETDVEAGGDDTALVDAAVELDDDLARTVVVDLLELLDVAVLLHDGEEADDDLGRGADENLTLAALLGVDDVVEAVGLWVHSGSVRRDEHRDDSRRSVGEKGAWTRGRW
jgi:hypothetical protein